MLSSNYSVTQLFLEHKVKIFDTVDNNISFYIKPPSAKEILTDDSYQFIYYLSTLTEDEFAKKVGLPNTKNLYEFVNKILKVYGQYAEFSDVLRRISSFMSNTFEDTIKVNTNGELIISPSIIITEEIWDYVLYIIRLSCGEKIVKPMTFSSKEAREFFEAQQKEDEKISAIKKENQKQVDENSIMKVILTIQYSFPSYSLDYLLNQTLAQIQWLHNYAAGAVSYEVNAKAYAAGNMKKDAKLNFFIK